MLTINGVQIPETIDELLIPSGSAHLIIDFQNDFCHPDGWSARNGGDITSYPRALNVTSQLITETRHLGVRQIFVRMTALPNGASDSPSWMRMHLRLAIQRGSWRPDQPAISAEEGTWGAEIVDELVPTPDDIIIAKRRSSAFFGTDLEIILRSLRVETLIVSGCTTEGCVESTVRDAGFRDFYAIVARDAVCSDSAALHEASLLVMSAYRADVVSAKAIIEALRSNSKHEMNETMRNRPS